MNLPEILNQTAQGILILGAGASAYVLSLCSLSALSQFFSRKIRNQEELNFAIREESKKLGLTKKVIGKFYNEFRDSAGKINHHFYRIDVGGSLASKSSVRHELYHIYRGHCEPEFQIKNKILDSLNYYLKEEPQVIAYELFRIKL